MSASIAGNGGRPAGMRLRALGIGACTLLALTACAGPEDDAGTSPSPTPTQTQTVESTETATATTTATATATATTTETGSPSASATETAEAGERFSAENGVFAWMLPAGWTAQSSEYSEEFVDYTGYGYEQVVFSSQESPLTVQATLGVGPTDGDGPKPDIVEVLDLEQLTDVPAAAPGGAPSEDTVWLRTMLVTSSEHLELPSGEDYELSVAVLTFPEGVDPQSTDEDAWSAWQYGVAGPEENQYGSNFISSSIEQSEAEELTGEQGEDAMRAVLETEDYEQLRALLTSMEVTEP